MLRQILVVLAIATVVLLTLGGTLLPGPVFSFSGQRPSNLGIVEGRLAACPTSPNCVSSQAADPDHAIAPLPLVGSPEAAIAKLAAIVQQQKRTRIVTQTENYLYAEFTSAIMGYVDDVEFFANPDSGTVEMRSASRLGESDLGVNRQRLETIRTLYAGT